jgi:hypothetical protein
MKNLLLGLGVIGLIPGAWFLYKYLYPGSSAPDRTHLVVGGGCFVVALICLAFFFFMKFREEGDQDISITKF